MRFSSFLRMFGEAWPRRKSQRKQRRRQSARAARCRVEELETRELLSVSVPGPPTIVKVTPVDGSTTRNTQPSIIVQFDESMQTGTPTNPSGANDPANYVLFGSQGEQIPIQSVAYDTTNNQATLFYNNGAPLIPDRYTLFVHGDQLKDLDENLPLAGPGQLVVASGGSKSFSLVNMPGDATLQAIENYQNTVGNPKPQAVALADVTGDGIPDLIVANGTTNTVDIYEGLPASQGGGFLPSPSATLPLPAGSNPTAVLATDFNGDGSTDIAVVDSSVAANEVTVFLNNGRGVFGAGTSYFAGQHPVAVVAADFTGSGHVDLAVADGAQDANSNFDVGILLGNGKGTFAAPVFFPTSLTAGATGLAVGQLGSNAKPDLVVSSGAGAIVLLNGSPGSGQPAFTPGQKLTNVPTTSVAIGNLNKDTFPDVVVTTPVNSSPQDPNGQVIVFFNQGNATFGTGTALDAGVNPLSVQIGALDNTNGNDIMVVNTPASGASTVSVLANTGGTGTFNTPVTYAVDSGPIGLAIHTNSSTGLVDLAATANATAGDVTLLRGSGNGTFLVSKDFSVTATTISAIVAGDLNGDSRTDVVIADKGTGTVSVFLQQSDGTYSGTTYSVGTGAGSQPDSLALANFTGKKNEVDIVVANYADNAVQILANDGTGHFTVMPEIPVGKGPKAVITGDFNNDGLPDIAVGHNLTGSAKNADHGVTVLLQSPSTPRSFPATLAKEYAPGTFADALVAAHFGGDKSLDIAVVNDLSAGQVLLLQNNGKGAFVIAASDPAGENPNSIAVGDLNRDGFPDVVVTNQSTAGSNSNGTFTATDYVTALLGSVAGGFTAGVRTDVIKVTASSVAALPKLQSAAIVSLSDNLFPDLVVSTTGGINNLATLQGDGTGAFTSIHFWATNGGGTSVPPSFLVVASDPFIRLTTFTIQGNIITSNLILNPSFEGSDLTGDPGNLDGWTTASESDSNGKWIPQGSQLSSGVSPFDEIPVSNPTDGTFAAMLDEPDKVLYPANQYSYFYYEPGFFAKAAQSTDYDGAHAMYQDVHIPASATSVTLSLDLYWDNTERSTARGVPNDPQDVGPGGFTDPVVTPTLDFFPNNPNRNANQQIRVDIVDPGNPGASDPLSVDTVHHVVLQNIFQTDKSTPSTSGGYTTITADLSQYAGKTIRLRIGEVNNLGRLIVGADNVQLLATFNDTAGPSISGLRLRNPGTNSHTTDPTIIGQVTDPGSFNNVTSLLLSVGNNFNNPASILTIPVTSANFDALGNFSVTLTQKTLNLPGPYVIGVEAVDRAGVTSPQRPPLTFTFQGPSSQFWQAMGPGAIDYSNQGVGYNTVSGDITSIALDPRDPSGNTFYVGTDNGGVWKTTDGGADYTPLTDYVTDASGAPVQVPIAGVAVDPSNPNTVYAATGIANNAPDSQPGVGILKSTDGGNTWTLLGHSVFNGARISKIVVSPLFGILVGVASTPANEGGPGLYQSTDGGLTWTNLMSTSAANDNMFTQDGHGPAIPTGTPLASVTDVQVSLNQQVIWVGMGNIGLTATASPTGGVWKGVLNSSGQLVGGGWSQMVGGDDPKSAFGVLHQTIPAGTDVQRVTIALANGPGARPSDRDIAYVLMNDANVSEGGGAAAAGNPAGHLYKTSTEGLSWTDVMLHEWVPDPNNKHRFDEINLLGGQSDPTNSEANAVGALIVDPANPYIVYLGGSIRFANPPYRFGTSNPPPHSFIMVNTTDMRDTTYADPFKTSAPFYPNDGDDIVKAEFAESLVAPPGPNGKYFDGATYEGSWPSTQDGVYWQDLTTNTDEMSDGILNFASPADERLPSAINTLAFDPQGRLLIGTVGGLFRGTLRGFQYDPTSGNAPGGFFAGRLPEPNQLGMDITDINGNLQIADQTSVAIDPNNPNLLDSSQLNLGWAVTDANIGGTLPWTSTNNPFFVGYIPGFDPFPAAEWDSGAIVAGPFDPTSTTGQSTLYRVHSFVVIVPDTEIETSNASGQPGTWNPGILQQDINLNLPTALFPALAVKSNVIVDANGNTQDELLFGNQQVWLSDTKEVVGGSESPLWDPISSNLGDTITAAAAAPTADHVFYVGTTGGKVYFETPGNPFVLASTGLPQLQTPEQINKIVVDPRDKTGKTAFAVTDGYGTGAGHVFMTINGGQSWTNISGNLADVPAYSVAINPQNGGALYVGNATGVWVSTNYASGKPTWSRLGLGLPNVPVRDIEFNQQQERIVVATQGRGTFQLSTRFLGPQVIAMSPGAPSSPPFTDITVTFDEAVDPRSFTPTNEVNARGVVVSTLDHGGQYLTKVVTGFYNQLLRRNPSATELSTWISNIAAGRSTDETVIATLVGSSEYFLNRAADSNTAWAGQMFFDILGRSPTPAELSTALVDVTPTSQTILVNGSPVQGKGLSRTTVALSLLTGAGSATTGFTGTEYQTNLVNTFYQKLLHRLPTALELSNALTNFKNGTTDENLLTQLVSSLEYYQKQGAVTSLEPTKFPSATVAFGDINGDGVQDKIVVSAATQRVLIYLGSLNALGQTVYASTPAASLALPLGADPQAVVVADFGNGKQDIAVANTGLSSGGANSVSVFVNTTTSPGQITFAARADYDGGNNPIAIAVSDMDKDGHVDLVVLDHGLDALGVNYDLRILPGNGTGTFGQPQIFSAGDSSPSGVQQPTGMVIADVNGDGRPDILISGVNGTAVLDNLSTPGTFNFSLSAVNGTAAPSAVKLADLNGDGIPDLIVANSGNNTVDIFTGKAGGGFNPAPTVLLLPQGAAPTGLVVGDFNGDGKMDIAVANGGLAGDQNDTGFVNSVTVFLNTTTPGGSLTFSAASYDGGNNPVAIGTGDFLNEGITDLVVLDGGKDANGHYDVYFLYGISAGQPGAGTFPYLNTTIYSKTGFTDPPAAMAVGDLNNDGFPDLALAGQDGVEVLLNDQAEFLLKGTNPVVLSTLPATSVAIGRLDTSMSNDVVATTGNINPTPQAAPIYEILIFQNKGDGTFPYPTTVITDPGTSPTAITVQDLNGDGLGDLIYTTDSAQGTVTVLKNTTVQAATPPDSITFGAPVAYQMNGNPVALALGDVNGDGVPDLVVANSSTDDVWELNGFTDGTFQTPTDGKFLNAAFQDVLGRLPSTTEINTYLATLALTEQTRLSGPRGVTVPMSITDVDPFGPMAHRVYDITFAPQVADGTYTLTIGPNLIDLVGNKMDQNGNLINGELPGDRFTGLQVINTSDDGVFLGGLFHDLLNRPADTTLFLQLLGPLDAARNSLLNGRALQMLTNDPYGFHGTQHWSNLVTGWLNQFLNGDQSNASSYLSLLQKGASDESVIATILGSDPYFQNHGSDNTAWIKAVYHDLFNAVPTQAQVTSALNQLKAYQNLHLTPEQARKTVALLLLDSTRYRTIYIKAEYQALLGRLPTATELAGQLASFAAGMTDEKFLAKLLSSPEYFIRAGNSLTAWLNSIYTKLNLTPDLTDDLSLLLNGPPNPKSPLGYTPNAYIKQRNATASAILTSTEYRTDLIKTFFNTYLLRAAKATDISFWLNQFATVKGLTDQTIIATLLSTYNNNEFFQGEAGSQNDTWLNLVYTDLVGRNWNPSSDPPYLTELNNQTITRMQVVLAIMATTEYRTNLLNNPTTGWFEVYLGRQAGTTELQFYLSQMAGSSTVPGLTNEQIIAELLSTEEYFLNFHQFP